MDQLQRHDIQGLVMSGHAKMCRASYFLLRVDTGRLVAARAWLADLAGRLTTSLQPEDETCLHMALTCQGLRAFGVSDDDMESFPTALREGMTSANRTRILGDSGPSAPAEWDWGAPPLPADPETGQAPVRRGPGAEDVHVLLLLFAKDDDTYAAFEAGERQQLAEGGLEVVHQMTPEPLPGKQSVGKFGVEHFGFADGMSQPVIRGTGKEDSLGIDEALRQVVEPGEFVLGYPNGYGKLTPWPKLTGVAGGSDFGQNGSYLVFRQLNQDVAGFWRFLQANARESDGATDEERQVKLGAKLLGRWPSGAPLVKADHRDDPDLATDNSFGFAACDRDGERCPLSAHIRRTNPRDSLGSNPKKALELANLHRILRRGRVFGPGLDRPLEGDDGQERGLFFLCLNANIERQFEFIQHTWCNNPKFAGGYDELDPLVSSQPAHGGRFTIQQRPVRRRLSGIPTFVTTRGGAYFFLPGIRAVRQLAALGG